MSSCQQLHIVRNKERKRVRVCMGMRTLRRTHMHLISAFRKGPLHRCSAGNLPLPKTTNPQHITRRQNLDNPVHKIRQPRWAEARIKITRMTLTIKRDRNWSSFQLANSAPPLSVTDSAIAPSARMASVRHRCAERNTCKLLMCFDGSKPAVGLTPGNRACSEMSLKLPRRARLRSQGRARIPAPHAQPPQVGSPVLFTEICAGAILAAPYEKLFTLLDLCVSSLRRGHANLLCIVPILTDDPRRESIKWLHI